MITPDLPSRPVLPDVPAAAGVTGVGMDLVHVPGLAHQLTIPGTVFAERSFTSRELRDAVEIDLGPGRSASRRWPVSITHDGDWAAAVVLAVV